MSTANENVKKSPSKVKSGIEEPKSSTGGGPRSPSSEVRSLSSQQSIGLETTGFDKNSLSSVSRMYDVVQMAVLCRQHRAILLVPVPKAIGLYFPFAIMKPGMFCSGQTPNQL